MTVFTAWAVEMVQGASTVKIEFSGVNEALFALGIMKEAS